MIFVERWYDTNNAEIRILLPQGESYILASRIGEDRYEVCVLLPWYGRQFFTGIDSTVICDELDGESWQSILKAPTLDLVLIILRSLPVIEQLNRDLDREI